MLGRVGPGRVFGDDVGASRERQSPNHRGGHSRPRHGFLSPGFDRLGAFRRARRAAHRFCSRSSPPRVFRARAPQSPTRISESRTITPPTPPPPSSPTIPSRSACDAEQTRESASPLGTRPGTASMARGRGREFRSDEIRLRVAAPFAVGGSVLGDEQLRASPMPRVLRVETPPTRLPETLFDAEPARRRPRRRRWRRPARRRRSRNASAPPRATRFDPRPAQRRSNPHARRRRRAARVAREARTYPPCAPRAAARVEDVAESSSPFSRGPPIEIREASKSPSTRPRRSSHLGSVRDGRERGDGGDDVASVVGVDEGMAARGRGRELQLGLERALTRARAGEGAWRPPPRGLCRARHLFHVCGIRIPPPRREMPSSRALPYASSYIIWSSAAPPPPASTTIARGEIATREGGAKCEAHPPLERPGAVRGRRRGRRRGCRARRSVRIDARARGDDDRRSQRGGSRAETPSPRGRVATRVPFSPEREQKAERNATAESDSSAARGNERDRGRARSCRRPTLA